MRQVYGMAWSCDLIELNKFIDTSEPNQRFIYYTGYNISDTIIGRELAKITYKLATKGVVYLVQSRAANYFDFNYYLIRASKIPVYKLVPLSEDKLTEKQRVKF